MKSKIIKKAEHLYKLGKIPDALHFYASSLWEGEEESLELLPVWLKDKKLLPKAGEKNVCKFIASLLLIIDKYDDTIKQEIWALCSAVLDNISECEDRDDVSDRYVVECNLYRHMKEPEKALKVILKGLSKKGTTSRYTFTGLTYLDMEKEAEAEKYLELGLQSDPQNASAYNDLGDYYFQDKRFRKARECYYKVLEAGDYEECQWAEPSWIFCCFMEDGSQYELERLVVYTAANFNNERAQHLCQTASFENLIPNVDYIKASDEAIINGIRSIRESGNTSPVTSCAVSCQESASSINAVQLALEEMSGQPCRIEITTNRKQNPPLEETIDSEGIVWWHYNDSNPNYPTAALAPPSDAIGNMVGTLACKDFSLAAWYEEGRAYAAKISAEQLPELYSAMIYPPKQAEHKYYAEDWLRRVQFAAVCILARISLHEIDKICKGQLDWPIIPAFTLAAWLSSQHASYTKWAENLLQMVQQRISQQNYCFFEDAYYNAAYLLPGKSEAYYTELWRKSRGVDA